MPLDPEQAREAEVDWGTGWVRMNGEDVQVKLFCMRSRYSGKSFVRAYPLERQEQKHKIKGIRRRWRKLHLGLDLASGAIVCANLTHDDVGDSTALPGLLDQLDAPVTGFLADGAYDGASTRDLLRERYGETLDVVIPPPKNAVTRPQSARDPTVRDRHIAQIRSNGRMAWQAATGYNQRSRIETQIGRWKSVIGPKLKSSGFSRQITEIKVGQKVLNTMTALGRPVFKRIA